MTVNKTSAGSVTTEEVSYTEFVREAQDRILHALIAGFGVEVGREAAEEALVYAWERWDRVSEAKIRGSILRTSVIGRRLEMTCGWNSVR